MKDHSDGQKIKISRKWVLLVYTDYMLVMGEISD